MTWNVQIYQPAKRDLDELPDSARALLVDKIEEIAKIRAPVTHDSVTDLSGFDDLYRVRVNRHRAIFTISPPNLCVLRVARRDKGVYNNLDEVASLRDSIA